MLVMPSSFCSFPGLFRLLWRLEMMKILIFQSAIFILNQTEVKIGKPLKSFATHTLLLSNNE